MDTRARMLALAEILAKSLSGAAAGRLADQLELVGVTETLRGVASADTDEEWLHEGLSKLSDARVRHWRGELDRLGHEGVSLVTIDDDAYPLNLRLIANRPPFLFVRGSISPDDERAIAVVGTRAASKGGLRDATELSGALAEHAVTVVSGLAAGIDTAAHASAINAGGRTIAVFGTGIDTVFPAANRSLARRIEGCGACVSQFWPDQRGARWTFPIRNIVTSGLSVGTVVVEASETSGARLQAQEALRHGKRLFLLGRLVANQEWARALVEHPRVDVLSNVDDLIVSLDTELRLPEEAVLI